MKIKALSRSVDDFNRERSQDLQPVFKNYDPSLRPLEKGVEYVHALNAVKLDKIFARPFIAAMDTHVAAISCMAKNPSHLKEIFSGSMDGAFLETKHRRQFDFLVKKLLFPGHRAAVRGLTVSTDGRILVSCGTDSTLCNVPISSFVEPYGSIKKVEPASVYVWKNDFCAADHQWDGEHFATGGAQADIWNHNRSQSVKSFVWRSDTFLSALIRENQICWQAQLETKTNSIAWNPMEPIHFTVANEDGSCYSYDSRKLGEAKCVHEDHVSAVMDIDYSPTGRKFVTGSYDKSLRIFPYNGGHSREIYSTKRMHRVFCVKFSGDGSYVISGSDDANLRLWKANASEHLEVILPRENKKHEYNKALNKRYRHLHEVNRIARNRHIPRDISP